MKFTAQTVNFRSQTFNPGIQAGSHAFDLDVQNIDLGVENIDPGVLAIDLGIEPIDPGIELDVQRIDPGINCFQLALDSFQTWRNQILNDLPERPIDVEPPHKVPSNLSTPLGRWTGSHIGRHCTTKRDVANVAVAAVYDRRLEIGHLC